MSENGHSSLSEQPQSEFPFSIRSTRAGLLGRSYEEAVKLLFVLLSGM